MQAEFNSFVADRRADLFATAYGITRDPHDAEDAVQEAVISGFLKLDQCKSPDSLPNWIRTITLNSARKVLRERKRTLPSRALGDLDVTVAMEMDEEVDFDRQHAMDSALRVLSDEEIAILMEHHSEDRSTAEIARARGITDGTLRSKMSRARNKLVDPLTLNAMEVLAEVYGQTFGPSLFARTQLISVKPHYSRGGRVFVLASAGGKHTFMLTVKRPTRTVPKAKTGAADPRAGHLVLDQDRLLTFSAQRLIGDDLQALPWDEALLYAIDNEQPISITKNLLQFTHIGDPLSQQRWCDIADQVWEQLSAQDDAANIQLLEGQLLDVDPANCLAASSALLRKPVFDLVRGVLQGRRFEKAEQEACRVAALGYIAKLGGELEVARDLFLSAGKLYQGTWEWSYHLAEANALLGDHVQAAASVVWALRRDSTGQAHVAIRSNPTIRSFLSIPRLWRLLPDTRSLGYPQQSFLPCQPSWVRHVYQAPA